MKYSFTQPLPKSIISHLTKIWIFYIMLSVGMIYAYGIYLNYQIKTVKSLAEISSVDMNTQDEFINRTNENMRQMRYEIELEALNKTYNDDVNIALLKLFELIPKPITINYIQLEENSLTLKGITPSRENYKFLLEAPLKSTFSKSRVDFFALSNGWFNFTSISTVEK